jgi:hypothetical protein
MPDEKIKNVNESQSFSSQYSQGDIIRSLNPGSAASVEIPLHIQNYTPTVPSSTPNTGVEIPLRIQNFIPTIPSSAPNTGNDGTDSGNSSSSE